MSHFIDAHTHAHFAAFKDDWKETIQRALDKDVWVVNVGTQKDTSRRAVAVAHEFKVGVFAAVGLHPTHTSKSFHDAIELGDTEEAKGFTSRGEVFDPENYLEIAKDPKTVAIGECGLDYFRIEGGVEEAKLRQKEAFDAQISLAKAVAKPLMIHCRDAYADLIDMLRARKSDLPPMPGIVHFFAGTVEDAKQFAELGFAFTFGGAITFPPRKGKPAGDYDAVISYLPLDRILSETDAPYITPVPYRGRRNEPVYVLEVVKRLAALKGISDDEMKDSIFANSQRIFRI